MKVAVSASGRGLKALVDPRFGRCLFFVIVEIENKEIKNVESIENPAVSLPRGAGIMAAQTVASKGVNVVITGNMGPNAYSALSSIGIEVYLAPLTTVEEAINLYLEGKLEKLVPSGRFGHGWGRRI